ncbi:MAG: DUF4270 domain-containing protein [Flavobacterium sp.]|nr:DUF4270 domain-containing protein [Flavobacterium sp.]
MNSIFSRIIFLLSIIIVISSCDKDVNEIGANLVGNDHYGYSSYTDASVIAFTQKTGPVPTNNLPVNQLGIYDNKVFGKTVANFATKLELATLGLTFSSPIVTSVTLNIPYYSTITSTDNNGRPIYKLDSITGKYPTSKIKLSVYRNGYEMLDIPDPFITNPLRNYSDQFSDVDGQKILGSVGRLNNSSNPAENDEFQFSNAEYNDSTTSTTIYSPPAMRLTLDNSMANDIFAIPASKFLKNFDFGQVYKGLYFKVEQSATSDGCLAMMDFSKGTVTIKYTEPDTSTTPAGILSKSITLNLTGSHVNVFENKPSSTIYESLPNTSPNATTTGDKQLYVKGGEGSVALIDMFGKDLYGADGKTGLPNGIRDEIDIIKTKGWLINEANLTFNIDKTANGMAPEDLEPKRILLYDVSNKRPMLDYYFDASSIKAVHGGFIEKTSSTAKGDKYKIRITNYIRNLINKDSTNVRLGLSIWKTVTNTTFGKNKNGVNTNSNYFPNNHIMSPLGTVLYGTNYLPLDADYDKRLKLEIWYTKPN